MLAIIRIKGELNLSQRKKRTLELLSLFKANHMVLKKDSPILRKMLKGIETLVSFGEIDEKTMELLLEKRAMQEGNKKLDSDFLKKNKISSFKEIAKEILEGKKNLEELGIKKVFRLLPPRKGYEREGIKRSFTVGGAWGNREQEINDLIKRMA